MPEEDQTPLTKTLPCLVCGKPVVMAEDNDDIPLCIVHYFTDDVSEDWENG